MPTHPNLSRILTKAWMSAKHAARRFGGSARAYLAETMRQAWATEKSLIKSCDEMVARVRAEVAAIVAMPRRAPTPTLVNRGACHHPRRIAA